MQASAENILKRTYIWFCLLPKDLEDSMAVTIPLEKPNFFMWKPNFCLWNLENLFKKEVEACIKCCCSSQSCYVQAHLPIPTQGEGNTIQGVPKQHFLALLRVVANTFGPAPFLMWLARTCLSCNYHWQQELPPPLHSFWRTNSFLSNRSGHKSEFQVSHLLFYVHCSYARMLFRNKILTPC